MSNIVTIAYSTEGTTDKRFLESIIKKTFEEVAFGCDGAIEVYDPVYIKAPKSGSFIDDMEFLSKEAHNIGSNVFCIHIDSDDQNDANVIDFKINPLVSAINMLGNDACKNIVAIVPIRMSEAWMLADKDLLKEEMNTTKSNAELGIHRAPESVADPKQLIIDAIRISQEHLPKRRNRLTIGELYQPVGQNISIDYLDKLVSFRKFKSSIEEAFRRLNFLH